ncbi:putative calcium-binding protein C613,03 [Rhizoctonia solani AG-1 IB]|uniref:Putative calcium-binding protein C613,03 n=1 Tax=Thanatephorus cucumeris (strain AG1-IB / isolate 7/3/14) TaxID=1108050 RepID=M5BZP0_THACB|nr:putative calcium-binding protein C613,03 [Rhizoctonia solani AG-1 IB]
MSGIWLQMASEHHIDAFNPSTFFQLHDLDRNGVLDRNEIEAIYGVHHIYSKRKTPSEEAQAAKAKQVADAVLAAMDTNGDGFITMEEFLAKGLDALPDFSALGAEGHHYDVESEFFLHHEEMYHNTPETQTDESYNHPEDM